MNVSTQTIRTAAIVTSVLIGVIVLAAFQNCAPVLPLDGVVDSSSLAVRATATPVPVGTTGTTGTTGGTYTGSAYDGICTSSFTDDSMALDTSDDVPGGSLVAFNNSSNGRAAFWNLNGGAIARATVCYFSTTGWSVQAVGDFDGDLNPDVIWRNGGTGAVVVWLMRGSTRISTGLVTTLPITSNIEGTADFDRDGKDDLLIRDANNVFTILQMNGTGTPTTVSLGTVTSTTHLLSIGSYYSASLGKKQIALFFNDTAKGVNTVWYMSGSTVASIATLPAAFISGATNNTSFQILASGDFNGDGNSDFLIQDPSTGNLRMRFSVFNGTQFAFASDSSEYSAAPTAWTLQGTQKINGDLISDWVWIIKGDSEPVLAYTPVSGSAGAANSIGSIRPGYSFFKYSHL